MSASHTGPALSAPSGAGLLLDRWKRVVHEAGGLGAMFQSFVTGAGAPVGVVLHAGKAAIQRAMGTDPAAETRALRDLERMGVTVENAGALGWTNGRTYLIAEAGPEGIRAQAVSRARFREFQSRQVEQGLALTVVNVSEDSIQVQRSVGGLLQQGPGGEPSVETVRMGADGPQVERMWHERGSQVAAPRGILPAPDVSGIPGR